MHVLVTGGNRGIGAAIVRAFAARGDRVTFLYHERHDAAQSVAAETGALALQADVASLAAVEAAFRAAPPADVLVNCAGIAHQGLISQITPTEWDRLFAVNVKGIYHCVNTALPAMLARRHGRKYGGIIGLVLLLAGAAGAAVDFWEGRGQKGRPGRH